MVSNRNPSYFFQVTEAKPTLKVGREKGGGGGGGRQQRNSEFGSNDGKPHFSLFPTCFIRIRDFAYFSSFFTLLYTKIKVFFPGFVLLYEVITATAAGVKVSKRKHRNFSDKEER
jgi:hypothetical protein